MSNRVLVTGGAGFIGFHLCKALLERGKDVITVDNLNTYYDVNLKIRRKEILEKYDNFKFYRLDLTDRAGLDDVFSRENLGADCSIVNLAAQAGVRYSLENPNSYIQSNLIGFFNLIDIARTINCSHFVYASSSSVYGGNTKQPFSIHDNVDHPISLYAASKKSNELLAHVYSYTYDLPTTGLRFFTVYGPWGRPDMAFFKFTKAILEGKPMPVFNDGNMYRDFTYIDDIIDGILRVMANTPEPNPEWNGDDPDPATSWVPFKVYNIGNNKREKLLDVIKLLEKATGKKAIMDFQPIQPGDVPATWANIDDLTRETDYIPRTAVEEGIPRFVDWFMEYHGIKK